MNRKKFYTLYQTKDGIDLLKDQGMVPYYMGKLGYEPHFISFIKPDSQDIFQKEVPELVLDTLYDNGKLPKYPPLLMAYKHTFKFIYQNRKQMDIFNPYYIKHSILYGIFYKLVRRRGLLYVKLDMDPIQCEREQKQPFNFIRKFVYRCYLKYVVDKITVESTIGEKFLREHYGLDDSKLLYIPNGIDDRYLSHVPIDSLDKKENIILTVARIGTYQKNSEMLLAACKQVDWRDDWKLYVVGPCTEEFREKITEFYAETHLQNRVVFTGPIYDKKELSRLYNRAKIFCLTSRYESFGIVCVEAQSYGDYFISTPIVTAIDFIPNQKIGRIVETAEELAEQINHLIDNPNLLEESFPEILQHAKQFRWSTITEKLDKFLQK